MVRVSVTLSLTCACATAQGGFGFQDQPFLAKPAVVASITPTTIGQLQRWWNFRDLTVGITVSNQWSDRVYTEPMWMMNTSLSPTNSTSGVRFNGAQRLTNNAVPLNGTGATNTIGLVFTFENSSQSPTIFHGGSGQGGILIATSSKLEWDANNVDVSSALPASTLIDVVAVQTNNNAGTIFYTNGLLSLATANAFHQSPFNLGWDVTGSSGPLKGYILHVLYWSNLLSASDVSNFHYWRTNTEGGTP